MNPAEREVLDAPERQEQRWAPVAVARDTADSRFGLGLATPPW
jgi:hypothetical protein